MGVTGLLPLLKSIQKQTHLEKFKGKILGVDAYGWLHPAAFACASDLAQGRPTRRYVQYAMNRINMLRHFGVEPYMVFDGDFLPSKAGTEAVRAESRERHKSQGVEYLAAGKRSLAEKEFQKAIDITPEMARHVIEELKKIGVRYVVAPYEADAQLVYLERRGLVDGILSEDSDLLVFGCKLLITKLDKYGACVEINRRDFCACREVSLTGWTDSDFRRMAILSGCDYLDGVRGTGLKTAYRYFRKYKTPEKVVQRMQFEGKMVVSEDYLPRFYQAELTFLHQRVFCPEKRELVLLTDDPTKKAEDMPFIGAYVEPEVARAVAAGDIDPMTKQPIVIQSISPRKQSPKRPRAPSTAVPGSWARGHTAAQQPTPTPTPAGSKPINSYFKNPGRIPMGEMDRNCFAVDPQRVAEITHNGMVPRVFPLPRPYLPGARMPGRGGLPRSNTAPSTISTGPRLRRTEPISSTLNSIGFGEGVTRRQTMGPSVSPTSQRPPKKARLCEDTEPKESDIVGQRSKFFSASASKSGSAKTTKEQLTHKEEYLFSDDSIEEALLALPDVDGFKPLPPARKAIDIFEDDSQGSNSTAPAESQSSSKDDQAGTQDTDIMPPPPRKETPGRVSLGRFFYQPGDPTKDGDDNTDANADADIPTPASTASTALSRNSVLFTPSFLGPDGIATPATSSSMMTPLQSIGTRALQRRSLGSPLKPAREKHQRTSLGALSSLPVNPAFVPLPRVDLAEVEALNACGSEDQLPFLDRENENEAEEKLGFSPIGQPTVRLDLSRFLHR